MTKKNKYVNGNRAIKQMDYIVGEVLWRERALPDILSLSIQEINKMYQCARDASIAFGKDVSKYPKRLRLRTEGAELLERGWRNIV